MKGDTRNHKNRGIRGGNKLTGRLLFTLLASLTLFSASCLRNADLSKNSDLAKAEQIESGSGTTTDGGTTPATAPSLSSVSPGDSASGIAINPGISVVFDQTMDDASVAGITAGTTCSGGVQISSDNFATCLPFAAAPSTSDSRTYVFNMAASLAYSTTYKIRVTTNAKGSNGLALPGAFTQTTGFTTASGPTTPSVASVTPADGGSGIQLNPSIRITFSETMNPSTIFGQTSAGACSGSVQISSDGFATCLAFGGPASTSDNIAFDFSLAANLNGTTTYRIRVASTVQSSGAVTMASDFAQGGWTTLTPSIPTVMSTIPTDGTTSVARGTSIGVTFSEAMDDATITIQNTSGTCTTGSIRLVDEGASTCVGIASKNTSDNISYTFNLAANLDYSKTYKIKVTTAAKSQAGINMSAQFEQPSGFETIAATVPTITQITSSTADGSYGSTAVINIQVLFSEVVNVAGGIPTLTLDSGGTANYTGGSSTNTLAFNYTVGAGHASTDLNISSINLAGATIRNGASQDANLTLPAGNNLADNKALVIDGAAPTITGVTSAIADGQYGHGTTLALQVIFNEPVLVNTVGGTPTLTLETGLTDRNAIYGSGSGTSNLVFNYTIQREDRSDDLNYKSTTALQLNGASIADVAGNSANLTLPMPASASSLASIKNFKIFTFILPDTRQTQCTYYNGSAWVIDAGCGAGYTIGSATHPAGQDAHYPNENGSLALSLWDAGQTIFEGSSGIVFQMGAGNTAKIYSSAETDCSGMATGGRSWRIPNIKELNIHLDYSLTDPLVETTSFFTGTSNSGGTLADKFYWTNIVNGLLGGKNWTINLATGLVSDASTVLAQSRRSRCVSGPAYPANQFVLVNTGGQYTVSDATTNLVWTRCPLNDAGAPLDAGSGTCVTVGTGARQVTWTDALGFCENLTYAGKSDWRLPNIRELISITDYSKNIAPLIDTSFFPQTNPGVHWTSTSYLAGTAPDVASVAHTIHFGNGEAGPPIVGSKATNNYRFYRCVRTGP